MQHGYPLPSYRSQVHEVGENEMSDGELFAIRPDDSEVTQLTDNQWEEVVPACRPEPLAGNSYSHASVQA